MHRLLAALSGTILVLAVAGCQKADDSIHNKLDDVAARLDRIEKQMASGPAPGAARPMPPRARGPQPGQPSPTDVYAVPIEGAPSVGPADAKVTIVKAYEFACPFCQRVIPTLDQLKKDYGDDVRIVYKNFIVHPQAARTPALAACAAAHQGKFKPMYDLIWEKGFSAGRNLARDNMDKLAQEIGLDMKRYEADMAGACEKIVDADMAQLRAVGTRGTPAFYINGRFLSGAQPIDRFKAIIDEELEKADVAIAKGTKKDRYYAEQVLAKGKQRL